MAGGIKYLRYFQRETAKPLPEGKRFCSLIIPCKGLDHGLEENLRAFLDQSHKTFEVLFVVESTHDAAVDVIEKLVAEFSHSRMIIAAISQDTGQKVANLREAVKHIDERSEILAFADSDARPPQNWLLYLTAPLDDENVGMTTGYRWFTPKERRPAGDLLAVWNASIASSLGAENNRFCWGGSMAISRKKFYALDVSDRWRSTVSDDFVLAKIMSEAELPIAFVPQALIPGIGQPTFKEMLEFTTRQIKLTRVYSNKMWFMLFLGSALHVIMLAWAAGILIFGSAGTLIFRSALVLLFSVGILGTIKAILRLKAISLVSPELKKAAKDQQRVQITLWVVTPLLFLYNCIVSAFSRTIIWRGVRYQMISDAETKIERIKTK